MEVFFFFIPKMSIKKGTPKKKKKKRGGEREEKIVPAKALTGYIGPFIFSCMNVLIFFSFVFFFCYFFFYLNSSVYAFSIWNRILKFKTNDKYITATFLLML